MCSVILSHQTPWYHLWSAPTSLSNLMYMGMFHCACTSLGTGKGLVALSTWWKTQCKSERMGLLHSDQYVGTYLIIYKVADSSLPSAFFKRWPLLQIGCSGLHYCTEFLNRKWDSARVNDSSSAFRILATDLRNYPRMKTHWKTQLWNSSPNRSHPSLSKRNCVFR